MFLESGAVLVVILLLGVVSDTLGRLASPCPPMCTCNAALKEVTCVGNTSLPTAIQYAPRDTRILHVDGGDMGGIAVLQREAVLPELEVLRISDWVGGRRDLFDVVARFKQLHELYLVDNQLQRVNFGRGSSSLWVIDLSHNLLEALDEDLFAGLYRLRILRLSNNLLKRFSVNVFSELESLEELDLSHNQIQCIQPDLFRFQPVLCVVDLGSNNLTSLHERTFSGLREIERVELRDNPWDCHCGMTWLQQALVNDSLSVFGGTKDIICATPQSLSSLRLSSIRPDHLHCTAPSVDVLPPSTVIILYMHGTQISCKASGYPTPSVYWITPHGIVVNPEDSLWLSPDLTRFPAERSYSGQPTFYKTSVRALANGSLEVVNLRSYFIGEYTCVAVNQVGNVTVQLNVTITSSVSGYLTAACIIGATTASGLAMLAMGICMLTICIERHCLKPRSHVKVLSVTIEPSDYNGPPPTYAYVVDNNSWSPSPEPSLLDVTPVCVTPADQLTADEQSEEVQENTRGTLEGVRARLRTGVGTGVNRIRSRAHNMAETSSRRLHTIRESSTQYMQTVRDSTGQYMHSMRESGGQYMNSMRESGGQYMHNVRESSSRYVRNIRESSSDYANRMRTGVVMGMEQVKSHVQSVKELCGTGTMIQTVSMVSVSTDVDSQQQVEVIKTISFV